MISMPADVSARLTAIDWSGVQNAVKDYGPALKVLQSTWDRESLRDIAQGKLFVPDSTINAAIERSMTEDAPVKSIQIQSHENGRMDIALDGTKAGRVELSGTIEAFVHNGDQSYLVYHVRSKNIPKHGLMSWVFSRISLGMAERLVGSFPVNASMPMKIRGNRVSIDYRAALAASSFGQTEFRGHRLLDMIEIKGAVPRDGGIEFQTELHMPADMKQSLLAILQQRE
ncbi:MAG: hypothetical protein SOV43_08590 [Selenomonadaceae bacterium]|nr:hypothetical protein [Selenomonadaceae bacterium]